MTIDTSSEEWRFQCEARHVGHMPSKEERKSYLKGVERHRGQDAMLKLHRAAKDVRLALKTGAQ